jgi:hypothetical protein
MPGKEATIIDGEEVEIEKKHPLEEGGIQLDVSSGDRTWRLDVDADGNYTLVTSWYDDTLADVPIPDWMDDLLDSLVLAVRS